MSIDSYSDRNDRPREETHVLAIARTVEEREAWGHHR